MQYPLICEAIRCRSLIAFSYIGVTRLVEPYAYGINHERHEVLRAYQVSGGQTGWRLFQANKMNHLSVLVETFSMLRSGYKRDDTAMRRIFCQI